MEIPADWLLPGGLGGSEPDLGFKRWGWHLQGGGLGGWGCLKSDVVHGHGTVADKDFPNQKKHQEDDHHGRRLTKISKCCCTFQSMCEAGQRKRLHMDGGRTERTSGFQMKIHNLEIVTIRYLTNSLAYRHSVDYRTPD
eukprot:gene18674-biopygen5577